MGQVEGVGKNPASRKGQKSYKALISERKKISGKRIFSTPMPSEDCAAPKS